MDKLSIDEIINHCNRQVSSMEERCGKATLENSDISSSFIKEYWEHRQVAQYLEEFKALKEKSVAKKPILRLCGDCQRDCIDCDRYEDRCPNCNGGLYVESGKPNEYCPTCGQKLDWE